MGEIARRKVLFDELFKELKELYDAGKMTEFRRLLNSKFEWLYLKYLSSEQILYFGDEVINYISANIEETFSKCFKSHSMDQREGFIKEKKAVIMKCFATDIQAVEPFIRMLMPYKHITKKDFKGYEAEFEKLSPLTKEVLDNPKMMWKILDHIQLVGYYINDDNKWELLDWFAENNPEMFKRVANQKVGRAEVVERYKSLGDFESLPPVVKEYIENTRRFAENKIEANKKISEFWKQKRDERMASWYDEKGGLLQFFKLEDGFPIFYPEDYLQIVEIFKQSGMSAYAFCKQYKIDSVDGFRELLKKVAYLDPEFAEFYEKNSETSSRAFVAEARNGVAGVVTGKVSPEEVIDESSSLRDFSKMTRIAKTTFDKPGTDIIFVKKMVDYFYQRLNSYEEFSTDESALKNRLTYKEIGFLVGEELFERAKDGKSVDFSDAFIKTIMEYIKFFDSQEKAKLYDRNKGIKVRLKPYSSCFNRGEYMSNSVYFLQPDGSQIKVEPQMVDMAECFVATNRLFKSIGVMNRVIKAVAEGKIQNQQETESYKAELRRQILENVKECKSIEEYFAQRKTKGE